VKLKNTKFPNIHAVRTLSTAAEYRRQVGEHINACDRDTVYMEVIAVVGPDVSIFYEIATQQAVSELVEVG